MRDSAGRNTFGKRPRSPTAEGGGIAVRTGQTTRQFDAVVVAAGAWSKKFAKQMGDSVSLDTERGYHISFASTGDEPCCVARLGFLKNIVFCRRCTTVFHWSVVMNWQDSKRPPDYRRIRAMAPFARSVLPGLAEQRFNANGWVIVRPRLTPCPSSGIAKLQERVLRLWSRPPWVSLWQRSPPN